MDTFTPTALTTVKRHAERGTYDRATVHAILDEALIAHVGFTVDSAPVVLPMAYGRIGDDLYLHGSQINRMLRSLANGVSVCVTVTLLDGLVLARSAFHHSMNYRSVCVMGTAVEVVDPGEKLRALDSVVEQVVPGRSLHARPPSAKEIKATLVLKLALMEVSAKIRKGPPLDDASDLDWPCWAGVLPLSLVPGLPVADPQLASGIAPEESVARYRRKARAC